METTEKMGHSTFSFLFFGCGIGVRGRARSKDTSGKNVELAEQIPSMAGIRQLFLRAI
jgi:hypothetical protein